MRRFHGEKLTPGGRIAVICNDALGNFVVVTSLLQLIREQLQPKSIDFYGGVRTWEFQVASDLFEWTFPLHGTPLSDLASVARERRGYDLIVNVERSREAKQFAEQLSTEDTFVCGPCADMPGHDLPFPDDPRGDLWRDPNWTSPDLKSRYPFLESGFIGEIFCRLCCLEGTIPPYKVPCESPECEIPPILISSAAALPEKLWPAEKWRQMLRFFSDRGLSVGLLGAHPIQQEQFWKGIELESEMLVAGALEDLRGKLSLPEVAGAIKKARLVLTIDNGILHIAVAVRKRVVGLFRHGIHRLWAPPSECLTVLAPEEGAAVEDLSVELVRSAVESAL